MKKIYTTIFFCICLFYSYAQWNSNTAENLAASALNSSDIVTAPTNDGRTYIAFYTQSGKNYYMHAQLLDKYGNKKFGDTGVPLSQKRSGTATFVFNTCVDQDNNLYAAFQYEHAGAYKIIINKVTPNGRVQWGRNGIEIGEGLAPYPVALTNGNIAVAWNNNGMINYQIIGPNGPKWAKPKKVSATPGAVSRPQLVALGNNTFGIVYQKTFSFPFYTNLYEQRFDGDGNPLWANPVQLSNYATASFHYYSVISNGDQTYVGYYANPTGQNRFDGLVQKVNGDGGLPWGINGAHFADYTGFQPYQFELSIAHAPGSPYIWAVATLSDASQFEYGIAVQKFDVATGVRYLGNNAKTVYPVGPNSERQVAQLSLCSDEPLFIFYDISGKLYATRLDAEGNFTWNGNQQKIGATKNQKGRYGFTIAAKNQAVAVWQENKSGVDMPYAQNIRCNGYTGPLTNESSIAVNKQHVSDILSNKSLQTKASVKLIYPNPVHNLLNISISAQANDKAALVITDAAGKIILQQKITISSGTSTYQLNMSGIAPGNYILQVTSKNVYGHAVQHFIKE